MDTALENGTFKINSRGYPVKIDSYDEILQRIIIRLLCKKGSFIYDRELGSELYKLKHSQIAQNKTEKLALDYAKQALSTISDINDITVKANTSVDGEQIELNFKINLAGEIKDINISI